MLCDHTFIEAVITGDASKIRSPYEDAVKSVLFTLACNESMETGKPVKVIHSTRNPALKIIGDMRRPNAKRLSGGALVFGNRLRKSGRWQKCVLIQCKYMPHGMRRA